jgi:hypothetical protein
MKLSYHGNLLGLPVGYGKSGLKGIDSLAAESYHRHKPQGGMDTNLSRVDMGNPVICAEGDETCCWMAEWP